MTSSSSVTVVMVGQGTPSALRTSLQSLTQQSLGSDQFRVLVVVIGPQRVEAAVIKQFAPDLDVYVEARDDPKAQNESFTHLEGLMGEYITFINEGDELTPAFLELLLREAKKFVVPVAQISEESDYASHFFNTAYNRSVLRQEANSWKDQGGDGALMTEIVGKMIPREALTGTSLMHAVLGHSLTFHASISLPSDFEFSRFPAALGATYYRHSAGLAEHSSEYSGPVQDLMSAIEELPHFDLAEKPHKQQALVAEGITNQLRSAKLRISAHLREKLLQRIAEAGWCDSRGRVLDNSVTRLAVVANFAPYAGTAGIVAAKRIIQEGMRVDVISSSMPSRKKQEADLRLTESLVREHEILQTSSSSTVDQEILEFIYGGLATFRRWQARGARYKSMYSRAMVPHSHFLAAAIKKEDPTLIWVAEFSDPLSLTVTGTSRKATFETSAINDLYAGLGSLRQQRLLLEESRMSRVAELLAYFYADRLIFTNELQLETMLGYAPQDYRSLIESKAEVNRHPTLPAEYYEMGAPQWNGTDDVVSLGYFGDFHSTRGMGELLEALGRLEEVVLKNFRLVVFTDSKKQYIHGRIPDKVLEIVEVRPRLGYLDFLATLNNMNVLIVNDSVTSKYFPVNPYLPSKVSDYLGSNTPIWAFYEAGSVLSSLDFAYRSPLGDASAAETVLYQILADAKRH